MKKLREVIEIKSLELNSGQLDWLPSNPRQWTRDDLDMMVKSLDEDPDFMEDRPPLVVMSSEEGKFIVFGGNMRVTAEKKRKAVKELLCIHYIPEDDDDRFVIRRRAMKDNGSFGSWDMDALANEWDDLPLKEWGVKGLPNVENIVDADDFKDRMAKINNENCLYPIVPEYDEEAEVFIILSRSKTDSNWLREKLGMQKMKSYKSDEIAKGNIISIEELKDVL